MSSMWRWIFGCVALASCGVATSSVSGPQADAGPAAFDSGSLGGADGGFNWGCPALPSPPSEASVRFAPAFASRYRVYELGPVPGVPSPLGGCAVPRSERGTLYIAGGSEGAGGALYSVAVRRDACGHIIGFDGAATQRATAPYIDANVLEVAGGGFLYTGWPVATLSRLLPGASSAAWTVDLLAAGHVGSSPGGLGQVPRGLGGKEGFRMVGWPDGQWHHLQLDADAGTSAVRGLGTTGIYLPNGPGGLAYVPAGSDGFPVQSVILSEWSVNKVAVYEVDVDGDPFPAKRRDFFEAFPRPWGAFFEPETGDFLFLTWGRPGQADSVFVVSGFEKPPDIN
jgi:hypothetical protein